MSDNGNDVHFLDVRLVYSPYIAISLALASLGPIMARCGLQMNIIFVLFIIKNGVYFRVEIRWGQTVLQKRHFFPFSNTFPFRATVCPLPKGFVLFNNR